MKLNKTDTYVEATISDDPGIGNYATGVKVYTRNNSSNRSVTTINLSGDGRSVTADLCKEKVEFLIHALTLARNRMT